MSKMRICPSCEVELPVGQGTRFDGDGNLLCNACGKVVMPVTLKSENAIVVKTKPSILTAPAANNNVSMSPHQKKTDDIKI